MPPRAVGLMPSRDEHSEAQTEFLLERASQPDRTRFVGGLMLPPPVGEGYWSYRVRLTDRQAIVGFPKFVTVGVGFAVEADWNTNLPYTCDATEIYEHIAHNKGDEAISREDCITAIRMIQDAVLADRAAEAGEIQ